MALYKLIKDPDDNSKTINIKKDLGNNTYLFIPFVESAVPDVLSISFETL